jgi:uncharacterized repeat protein (TIGR01451 family)
MKRHLFHILAIPLIGIALALSLAPTVSHAATAAGTVITNVATVSWSGAPAILPTASATVTVDLLPSGPTVTYVSTNPVNAAIAGTGTGAASPVAITYTVTSTANGTDTYTLGLSSAESANLGIPTFAGGNPGSVSLGASMALNAVAASNTVVIPGLAVDHGLANGETVIIGGNPYTISNAVAAAGNTTLTLSGNVTMSAGDPIYEQRTLVFNMTTGTFTAPGGEETHTLTLDATSDTAPNPTGTVTAPVIYVERATLTIAKTANPLTGKPGDTITYTITVTNTGTSDAANVTISDATPAFTTYVGGSGSYSVDGGAPVAIADGAIAGGVNIGTLAATKIAVVTFQVTIN